VGRVDTSRPSVVNDPLAGERARLKKEREELARLKTQEEKGKIGEEGQRLEEERKKLEVERQGPQEPSAPVDSQEVGHDGVYIACANGIVKDTKTGLEWVAGPDRGMTKYEAEAWVESLNVAGGGWRMPTTKELKELYQQNKGSRNMTPLLHTTGWAVWPSDEPFSLGFSFSDGSLYFPRTPVNPSLQSPIFQAVSAFAVRFRGGG
jgi:hypothetical protein